mgnify:CR=1 FL=1
MRKVWTLLCAAVLLTVMLGSVGPASFAEETRTPYQTGDQITFGSYPQTRVTDQALLEALNALTEDLPGEEGGGFWNSYGYYADGQPADYAFYTDVIYREERYRGVYLTAYRPIYTGQSAGAELSYIDDNGYELNTVYWFRFEPIVWNVLSCDAEGQMLLAASRSLEGQPFQNVYNFVDGETVLIPDTEIPVHDWENSTLRVFLNDTFFQTAFTAEEQARILPAELDNQTTGISATAAYQIRQKNTIDHVFLQAVADVKNKTYGYSSKGASRVRGFTDYAAIQGVRASNQSSTADGAQACFYLLRSAGAQSYLVAGVSKNGAISSDVTQNANPEVTPDLTEDVGGLAWNGAGGILPCISMQLPVVNDSQQPAIRDEEEKQEEKQEGKWVDAVHDYVDGDGQAAQLNYSLYVPAAYREGVSLPLIVYIPDSSYVGSPLTKVKRAQCPTKWITEENMAEHPAFFLIFAFKKNSSDLSEGAEGAQIVPLIDQVTAAYGIDENRLYLTGQSMGGITDFALNDAYPHKFAATVYVGCQPGGEVRDDQYNAIIQRGAFVHQKFIYITSRKDEKAPYGQDDVEAALQENGMQYGEAYGLDHKGGEALEAAVQAVLDQQYNQNFFGFEQVTSSGNGAAEHMQSFKYAYAIQTIFDWLMAQHL